MSASSGARSHPVRSPQVIGETRARPSRAKYDAPIQAIDTPARGIRDIVEDL
jgi:hypothetical protein